MNGVEAELEQLAEDFALLEDPLEQLAYVRDLGRDLDFPEAERTEANRLHGCSSAAWLTSGTTPDGRLAFRGTAEAIIPRGVVALLLKLYSGRTPDEVLSVSPQDAMARLGLSRMLSMNRISGLAAMGARIEGAARAAHPIP